MAKLEGWVEAVRPARDGRRAELIVEGIRVRLPEGWEPNGLAGLYVELPVRVLKFRRREDGGSFYVLQALAVHVRSGPQEGAES